jgi:hypothetical protein
MFVEITKARDYKKSKRLSGDADKKLVFVLQRDASMETPNTILLLEGSLLYGVGLYGDPC